MQVREAEEVHHRFLQCLFFFFSFLFPWKCHQQFFSNQDQSQMRLILLTSEPGWHRAGEHQEAAQHAADGLWEEQKKERTSLRLTSLSVWKQKQICARNRTGPQTTNCLLSVAQLNIYHRLTAQGQSLTSATRRTKSKELYSLCALLNLAISHF